MFVIIQKSEWKFGRKVWLALETGRTTVVPRCRSYNINIFERWYLQWSHPQLLAAAALGDLGQVVDQPLEDVGGVQVTVVVDVDVDHTLGVCGAGRDGRGCKSMYKTK